MFINVVHDVNGNIKICSCVDTYPSDINNACVSYKGGTPPELYRAIINIDTILGLDIMTNTGDKAIIDTVTNQPKIVKILSAQYIRDNYIVDMTQNLEIPSTWNIPVDIKLRVLKKKI